MKILHYVFANKDTGLGHWHRSLALAQTARQRGHIVNIASDRTPPYPFGFILTAYRDKFSLISALQLASPDWLIVDMPDPLPEWLRELADEAGCKICTLNGIGYNQNDGSDLRIIQGVADIDLPGLQDRVEVLKGIDYVILRPEIAKYQNESSGQDTLVWGGGMDVLGIHKRFFSVCPGRFAVHILSDMIAPPILNSPTQTYLRLSGESESIFGWIASSRDIVAAMGVIAWESAFLRRPIKVFSASPLHLVFAQGMERAGLLRAYPQVGLPEDDKELREFLDEPFEPTGQPPDDKGAERIIEAIEKRS
jgi:spore coat polysaccharide biosynthesis predicted glycosyltransferase SpsG